MDGLTFDDEKDLEFLRDKDSLYALPLPHVPLDTTALRRGRLVKTFPLDSAIEIFKFSDRGMGVKLTRWREQFPTAEHGSADRRFEVLHTEIRPGMGKLMALATGEEDFLRV